jgi:hypothetical protein
MAKVVITLGWKKYVVDAQQALMVTDMLSKAEVYESKYTGEDRNLPVYYVYPQEEESRWMMEIMPDSIYRMAKLAGKPEKD